METDDTTATTGKIPRMRVIGVIFIAISSYGLLTVAAGTIIETPETIEDALRVLRNMPESLQGTPKSVQDTEGDNRGPIKTTLGESPTDSLGGLSLANVCILSHVLPEYTYCFM